MVNLLRNRVVNLIGLCNFNHPSAKISIDTILYSPNKLKLFAFVIIRYPNDKYAIKKSPNDTIIYDGRCLIAFRDSINRTWNVYEYDQYQPAAWLYYLQVQNLFRDYYFNEFKNAEMWTWNVKTQEFILEKFIYNVNQKDFWKYSSVWRKGNTIQGYYDFQITSGTKPNDKDFEIEMPTIDYPDSILKMFK